VLTLAVFIGVFIAVSVLWSCGIIGTGEKR